MLACVCVWAEAQAHGLQQTHEAEWVASGRTPKTWAGQAPAGVSPGVGVAQGIEAQSTEGDHPRTYIAHHIAHQVIVVTDRQAYEELKDAAGASAVGSGAGGFEAAAACAPGPAAPASTAYVQGGLEVFRALTAAAPHAHEFVDARAATNASAQAAAAPSGSVSSVRGAPDEGQCAQVDGEEEQEQDVAEEAEQDEARRVQDVSPPPATKTTHPPCEQAQATRLCNQLQVCHGRMFVHRMPIAAPSHHAQEHPRRKTTTTTATHYGSRAVPRPWAHD